MTLGQRCTYWGYVVQHEFLHALGKYLIFRDISNNVEKKMILTNENISTKIDQNEIIQNWPTPNLYSYLYKIFRISIKTIEPIHGPIGRPTADR